MNGIIARSAETYRNPFGILHSPQPCLCQQLIIGRLHVLKVEE